ncbi:hypothetical protein [Variovorax sp. UC122_21]|uniref:hypothetical protein n=1 Tax=Variovorax sp. UC122_21 TaxID=3374554 RepID=UPI0037574FFE
MNTRPRTRLAAAGLPAGVLLALLVSGCSHYQIGIPIVPGLSLGLGATRDGNFSVGLNTGFGPLGAGVAVSNSGAVAGSVGMGLGVGPVGAGVGQTVVLHDPNAGKPNAVQPGPVTSVGAGVGGSAGGFGVAAELPPTGGAQAAQPAPAPAPAAAPVSTAPRVNKARAPGVLVRRNDPARQAASVPPAPPAAAPVQVTYRAPEAAAPARVGTNALGSPGNPIAP